MKNDSNNQKKIPEEAFFAASLVCVYQPYIPVEGNPLFTAVMSALPAIFMIALSGILFRRCKMKGMSVLTIVFFLSAAAFLALWAMLPTKIDLGCFFPAAVGITAFAAAYNRSSCRSKILSAYLITAVGSGALRLIPGFYLFDYMSGHLFLCAAVVKCLNRKEEDSFGCVLPRGLLAASGIFLVLESFM